MPISSFPLTITVKDDSAAVLSGAKAYLRNVTKKTNMDEVTTGADGKAVFDLANFPIASGQSAQYETGDKILMIAYYQNTHDAVLWTVSVSSKSQTLTMNPIKHTQCIGNNQAADRIKTFVVANTHASTGYYAKVYAVDDGQTLLHVEVLAGSTQVVYCDSLSCSGGFAVERESTSIIATAVLK